MGLKLETQYNAGVQTKNLCGYCIQDCNIGYSSNVLLMYITKRQTLRKTAISSAAPSIENNFPQPPSITINPAQTQITNLTQIITLQAGVYIVLDPKARPRVTREREAGNKKP